MKTDADGLPKVESSAYGLGVRSDPNAESTDVDLDLNGAVLLNGKGMSVAPHWRKLPIHRIPKRLKPKVPSARGSNDAYCFVHGDGDFANSPIGKNLELIVDSSDHGVVAPREPLPIVQFDLSLAQTRSDWTVDEN